MNIDEIPYVTFPCRINVRLSARYINACVSDDAPVKASFTRTVNVSFFMRGTFDLFHVMCKQYHI